MGERTAGVPDPCLSQLPPQARSPGSSSDLARAAGERKPPPGSVPAGSRRPGAAAGRGQPCQVPEAPSHLVSLRLACGGVGLPTAHAHPLTLCPRALQFLTCPSPCAHFSNLLLPPLSHSSRSSAPRPVPPWYPGRPEPGLGPSAICFQATVGFSVLTACPSLNGKTPTQLCSRGAVRAGGRA